MDEGKPTGEGGGGGGWRGVARESFGRVYLGCGEASMAFERSWLRVLEVAIDRRRRSSGSGYAMSTIEIGECNWEKGRRLSELGSRYVIECVNLSKSVFIQLDYGRLITSPKILLMLAITRF